LALLTLVTSGCIAQHGYAQGSVSYTSTPATAEHTGALLLLTLVCLDSAARHYRREARIRLGGSCTLAGPYEARHGRNSTRGGTASLVPDGVCSLPTAAEPIPVRV